MPKIGLAFDDSFLLHVDPDGTHPESPQRIITVMEGLKSSGWWGRMEHLPSRLITLDELVRSHDASYVETLARLLSTGSSGWLDPDTYYSPHTRRAAFTAAAGVTDLVKQVWKQELDAGLALVRPPGHHAERDAAMGFCIINNVAVAAANLLAAGAKKVAVVDFDVHHGNGTQHIFYDDPRVLYISLHQWPLYPGTGWYDESGRGDGVGFTVNVPVAPYCGDIEWMNLIHCVVAPVLLEFRPEVLILSGGFDAHRQDHISAQQLSDQGISGIIGTLVQIARDASEGRVVMVLEGGYVPAVILHGVRAFLGSVESDTAQSSLPQDVPNLPDSSPLASHLAKMLARHREFWKEVG